MNASLRQSVVPTRSAKLRQMLQSTELEFLMEAHNGLSARIVRECWSPDPEQAARNIAALRDDLYVAVRKLDMLVRLYPFSHEASA